MARRGPEALDPEQERLLKEAKHMVSVQSFQMKRALDQSPPNLMEALKHASNMINELRTGLLSPKAYEELYRLCFDNLRHLESFLHDPNQRGRSLLDLYQLVQYADPVGNILPRLYLLVTVGSVYIRSLDAPANDIMYDLVELCRGVQHPTRGLFLRNYLSEMTKDLLPDEGSQYKGEVTDSIDFIIANFTEMNKLWVRMQHGAGPIRSPEQRERERSELSLLIGKNLQRLSQLEGLTLGLYKSDVLPRILTQIVQCRDRIAQQYLLEIIIQVFSDDFHLRTLEQLLSACLTLVEDVDVAAIIAALVQRLSKYCETNLQSLPQDLDMFKTFTEYTDKLLADRAPAKVSLAAVINLDASLVNLALKVYNGEAAKLDQVFSAALSHIVKKGGIPTGTDRESKQAVSALLSLLKAPLWHFKNVRRILTLTSYGNVVDQLPADQRKKFAGELVENILSNETTLPVADEVDTLFKYLASFVKQSPSDKDLGPEDWEDDQNKVAYVIQMLNSPEIDQQFAVLMKAYEHVQDGGVNRIKFTYPALVFKALHLVQRIYAQERTESGAGEEEAPWEKKLKRIFKFANDVVTALKTAEQLQLAFRLYLECALAAGRAQMRNFAYGFLTKGAIAIYEEDAMAQSKMEYDAIRLLISTVNSLDCFDEENYTFLATRLAQHSSKLLNLDDQSRAVELSAHLFVAKLDGGKTKFEAPDRVLSCLKKSMTVADVSLQSADIFLGNIHESDVMIELLVDLLDRFLFFYETMSQDLTRIPPLRLKAVDVAYINAIIKKIHKHFTVASLPSTHPAITHFAQVKAHVQLKEWKDIQF